MWMYGCDGGGGDGVGMSMKTSSGPKGPTVEYQCRPEESLRRGFSFSFSFSSRWHRTARKGSYALRPVS